MCFSTLILIITVFEAVNKCFLLISRKFGYSFAAFLKKSKMAARIVNIL